MNKYLLAALSLTALIAPLTAGAMFDWEPYPYPLIKKTIDSDRSPASTATNPAPSKQDYGPQPADKQNSAPSDSKNPRMPIKPMYFKY